MLTKLNHLPIPIFLPSSDNLSIITQHQPSFWSANSTTLLLLHFNSEHQNYSTHLLQPRQNSPFLQSPSHTTPLLSLPFTLPCSSSITIPQNTASSHMYTHSRAHNSSLNPTCNTASKQLYTLPKTNTSYAISTQPCVGDATHVNADITLKLILSFFLSVV